MLNHPRQRAHRKLERESENLRVTLAHDERLRAILGPQIPELGGVPDDLVDDGGGLDRVGRWAGTLLPDDSHSGVDVALQVGHVALVPSLDYLFLLQVFPSQHLSVVGKSSRHHDCR